jgi:peroxiredoxin
MKKKILLLLMTIISGGLSYFGYRSIQNKNRKQEIVKAIQQLPFFSFYSLNEEVFTSDNSAKKSTLIIYFHPECEHCQYEAKQVLLYKEQFRATQIFMISPAPLEVILKFKTDYQLDEIGYLKVLWDKDGAFESYFGDARFPTILIYDTENKIQKKYNGEVKIEAILNYLNQAVK